MPQHATTNLALTFLVVNLKGPTRLFLDDIPLDTVTAGDITTTAASCPRLPLRSQWLGTTFSTKNCVFTSLPIQFAIGLNPVLWLMLPSFICFLFIIWLAVPCRFSSTPSPPPFEEVMLANAEVQKPMAW